MISLTVWEDQPSLVRDHRPTDAIRRGGSSQTGLFNTPGVAGVGGNYASLTPAEQLCRAGVMTAQDNRRRGNHDNSRCSSKVEHATAAGQILHGGQGRFESDNDRQIIASENCQTGILEEQIYEPIYPGEFSLLLRLSATRTFLKCTVKRTFTSIETVNVLAYNDLWYFCTQE